MTERWYPCPDCAQDVSVDEDEAGRAVTVNSRECNVDPYAKRCVTSDDELLLKLNED